MFNLINLEDIREFMISEIETDISKGLLYISDRLNSEGKEQYPIKLLEAAKSMNTDEFINSFGLENFNSHYPRKTKTGFTQAKMPYNANSQLCGGEFNRFYIRAVCLKAINLGKKNITVYRARPSDNPRIESLKIEGKEFNAEELLKDLRTNIGVDTALGLPPGPNSGMSAHL